MVHIDIPVLKTKYKFISDGTEDTITLPHNNPLNIQIFVSGIYLTEDEDYTVDGSEITFAEVLLKDENVNILYNY